jgi:hypothetical protein
MKKTIITTIATICVLTLTITSGYAGSAKKHRERLKGFIIGSSAGFLGATILNQVHNKRPRVIVTEPRHGRRGHGKHYRGRGRRNNHGYNQRRHGYRGHRGHWEIKRRWVPEEYDEEWIPGHYNKRGRWMPGKYKRYVVREGYWKEKRIWVSRY